MAHSSRRMAMCAVLCAVAVVILGLGTLIERFEIADRVAADAQKFCPKTRSRYHCALYDAIAAAHLLVNMCEHPAFARSTILDLVRASSGAKRFQNHIQAEFDFF